MTFLMTLNILETSFLLLINVLYFEDVLWKERTKYQNYNQILHLLILFTMSNKLLVMLFFNNNQAVTQYGFH